MTQRKRRQRDLPEAVTDGNETAEQRDQKGRFKPGNAAAKGHGRKSCRYKRLMSSAVTDDDLREIINRAVKDARKGNRHARAFIFDRVQGRPRIAPADPISVPGLPEIVDEETAIKAAAHIVAQVADGKLAPDDAQQLTRLILAVRGVSPAHDWIVTAAGIDAPAAPTFL